MSFIKKQLKAAREALGSKSFEYAQSCCQQVLENDPCNYNALVFLGLAELNLNNIKESQSAYERAIAISPDQPLAYQGLEKLHIETLNLVGQMQVLDQLIRIYAQLEQKDKVLECIRKQESIAESLNDVPGLCHILMKYSSHSSVYELIKEFDIPSELQIWKRIARIQKDTFDKELETQIDTQRQKLGSDPVKIIRNRVERELINSSPLETYFQNVLCLETDENEIKNYQKEYLEILNLKLKHSDISKKEEYRNLLISTAEDLIQKTTESDLAFQILIESQNERIEGLDFSLIQKASLMQACPFQIAASCFVQWKEKKNLDEIIADLSKPTEVLATGIFAHHLLTAIYLGKKDWSNVIIAAEASLQLCDDYAKNYGQVLSNVMLELRLWIAQAYLLMDDKHVAQGLATYNHILQEYPAHREASLGRGECMIKLKRYQEAKDSIAHLVDISDEDALFQLGWIEFHLENYTKALDILKQLPNQESHLVKYRLAKIYWHSGENYRKDKAYVHTLLIDAIRKNPEFSPSFTLLGSYYMEEENDIRRAAKCYVKALEINPNDGEAVQCLCKIHISESNFSEASHLLLMFSKNNARSFWVWNQLGILSLHGDKISEAIGYFQTALRLEVDDAICWTSLGECYLLEGKYTAAIKALNRALDIDPESSMAYYTRAIVNHRLLQFELSIRDFEFVIKKKSKCIPSTKGLVEVLIAYARDLYEQGAFGQTKSCLLRAVALCLDLLEEIRLECILKLLGDCATYFYRLTPNLVAEIDIFFAARDFLTKHFDSLDESLKGNESNPRLVILEVSAFAYQAAFLISNNGFYHYDLSLSLYFRHKETKEDMFNEKAIHYMKNAISYFPDQPDFWNGLGILTIKSDPPLSQHSFIQALELNPSPLVWCNLGYFYLIHGDRELASQAFKKAQLAEPEWAMGWLGSALVAKEQSSLEKFELLEHAFGLGKSFQFELLYLYAQECITSPEKVNNDFADACYALLKCSESLKSEPAIYNLYGLVLEKQGLFDQAILNFQKAEDLLENGKELHMVTENKARALCLAKQYQDSVSEYMKIIDSEFSDSLTHVSFGIALFFNQELNASLQQFEIALQYDEKPKVALYLSQVLYALGGPDHLELAKQQLLQCFMEDNTDVQAILHLFAIGISLSDWELAQTAAAELLKLEPHTIGKFDAEVDELFSILFRLQGDLHVARNFLIKTIHRYPWRAQHWTNLSKYLSTYEPLLEEEAKSISDCGIILSNSKQLFSSDSNRFAGLVRTGTKGAKSRLCKAIRMNPSSAENWLALAIELNHSQTCDSNDPYLSVVENAEALGDESIQEWCQIFKAESLIKYQKIDEAVELLDSVAGNAINLQVQQVSFTLLGQALGDLDVDAAIASLKKANEAGDHMPAIYELGSIYEKQGQIDAAKYCWKIIGDSNHSYKISALLQYARLCLIDDDDDAKNAINSVLKIKSNHSAARQMQAFLKNMKKK